MGGTVVSGKGMMRSDWRRETQEKGDVNGWR